MTEPIVHVATDQVLPVTKPPVDPIVYATKGIQAPQLLELCQRALPHADSSDNAFAYWIPGRIEVLGKHTDYAGGRSLLCAIDRGIVVVARPRVDRAFNVIDAKTGDVRSLSVDVTTNAPQGDWASYAATILRSVARNFPSAQYGADVAFASNLPASSGMSSSSALVIAMFQVLRTVNHLDADPVFRATIDSNETLGNYLGAVENGRSFGAFTGDAGVGTLGGSQDQTAILCCREGMISQFSFGPVRMEAQIPLTGNRVFVVAFSGVGASKATNALHAYNEASRAVSAILDVWNSRTGRSDQFLADAVSSGSVNDRIRAMLADASVPDFTADRLRDRFDQFITESNELIPDAAAALRAGDFEAFGVLVDRSQYNAECLLGNQVPETIALARLARELGADAASAFGAGFGGSVWAMVDAARAQWLLESWRAAYAGEFPDAERLSEFFISKAGDCSRRVALG